MKEIMKLIIHSVKILALSLEFDFELNQENNSNHGEQVSSHISQPVTSAL
jgi:hypothetical protein